MPTDPLTYLVDAIGRIERAGLPAMAGSHVAGIFGKGANGFEKEVRAYVARLLKDCGVDYAAQLRSLIRGPAFPKTTLGHLAALVRECAVLKPKCVSARVPSVHPPFLVALERINETWVQLKHGDEVDRNALFIRIKSMREVLEVVRALKP